MGGNEAGRKNMATVNAVVHTIDHTKRAPMKQGVRQRSGNLMRRLARCVAR